MPFSKEVREQALIAAARHCCVCHRYKGVKIEVHHIEPESEGGENTFKNSISLCFDCHADAGHYNTMHPKGSKFSRAELVKARETWHRLVAENKIIAPAVGSEHLHFRYFMCSDEYEARRVYKGDLSGFPVKNALLAQNEIYDFWKWIEETTDAYHKNFRVEDNNFTNAEEYLRRYPDAEMIDKSDTRNPYFTCRRVPSKAELLSGKYNIKESTLLMVNSNANPEDFCEIVSYASECGSGWGDKPYTESLSFRSTWFVFLVATNVSSSSLQVAEFHGTVNLDKTVFRSFHDTSDEVTYSFELPKTSIMTGESIIFPVCIVSPPMDYLGAKSTILDSEEIEVGTIRTLTRIDSLNNKKSSFNYLGPYIRPLNLTFVFGTELAVADVHQFNLDRLYTVSTHWEAGCCPHLFFKRSDGKIIYVRGLFTNTPGELQKETIAIPDNVFGITIAELEPEQTWIESIKINGVSRMTGLRMLRGDHLDLDVRPGDSIQLVGKYETTLRPPLDDKSMFHRNALIGKFMRDWYELARE